MDFLLQLHSWGRWFVLVVMAVAAIRYLVGFLGKQKFDSFSETLMKAFNAVIGLQALMGLALFVWTWMEQGFVRQRAEHGFAMIVAIALVGALSSRWKKLEDNKRYRNYFILILVVFAILLVGMVGLKRDPMALFS